MDFHTDTSQPRASKWLLRRRMVKNCRSSTVKPTLTFKSERPADATPHLNYSKYNVQVEDCTIYSLMPWKQNKTSLAYGIFLNQEMHDQTSSKFSQYFSFTFKHVLVFFLLTVITDIQQQGRVFIEAVKTTVYISSFLRADGGNFVYF